MNDLYEANREYSMSLADQKSNTSQTDQSVKPPFFILGCVRSGTTLLRDVIASHPLLYCPNETHFFRYADPFGTMPFMGPLQNAKVFQKHRELDNITEDQFRDEILLKSKTRRELMENYAAAYMKAQNAPPDARWFDKTPQNVYGILLIAAQYPDARFVHIIRNPLNVIASLQTTNVMKVKSIIGAANYWAEAAAILKLVKPILGDRLLEIGYEEFTIEPQKCLQKVFCHIGEDPSLMTYNIGSIKPEKNRYLSVLKPENIDLAREICGDLAREYGFKI